MLCTTPYVQGLYKNVHGNKIGGVSRFANTRKKEKTIITRLAGKGVILVYIDGDSCISISYHPDAFIICFLWIITSLDVMACVLHMVQLCDFYVQNIVCYMNILPYRSCMPC